MNIQRIILKNRHIIELISKPSRKRSETFFGYGPKETLGGFMPEVKKGATPLFMIRLITDEVEKELKESELSDYSSGHWLLSIGPEDAPEILGPFETMNDAVDKAHELFNVRVIPNRKL